MVTQLLMGARNVSSIPSLLVRARVTEQHQLKGMHDTLWLGWAGLDSIRHHLSGAV